MGYDSIKHHRRSIRLKGYDYSQPGSYFVTLCVQNRTCLFGDVVEGVMVLNDSGRMIEKWYAELENKFPGIVCGSYVIMPNHMHFIITNVGADALADPKTHGQLGKHIEGGDMGDEHIRCGHVGDEHMRCGHVGDEHMRCGHVRDERIRGRHVGDERIRGGHVGDERIRDGHVGDERIRGRHVGLPLRICLQCNHPKRNVPGGNHPEQIHPERNGQFDKHVGADLCVCPEQIHPKRNVPEQIHPKRNVPEQIYPERNVPEQIHPKRNVPERIHPERNGQFDKHVGADLCVCPLQIRPERNVPEQIRPERNVSGGNGQLGKHVDLCVCPPLHQVVQWFKTMTTNAYIRGVKQLGWVRFDRRLWQRNYYERIIRDENGWAAIHQYITNNPAKWEFDKENPKVVLEGYHG